MQADIALMVSHPSVADYEKAQPGDGNHHAKPHLCIEFLIHIAK